jgi:HEAT repeat protein
MVRRRAVMSLGQLGGNDAVQPLIGALCDPDTVVVVWAIKALGSLGDTCALEPLLSLLGVQSFQTDVAEALARIGDRRAIEPLRAVAETCDSCAAVHEALRALQKAGG